MFTYEQLQAVSRVLESAGDVRLDNTKTTIEDVEAVGRMPDATRGTYFYAPDETHPGPWAIEFAHIRVGVVFVNVQCQRPVVAGEPTEMDFRTQAQRDAAKAERERLAAEATRATVVTPPRPVFCGESRWSWLEVD